MKRLNRILAMMLCAVILGSCSGEKPRDEITETGSVKNTEKDNTKPDEYDEEKLLGWIRAYDDHVSNWKKRFSSADDPRRVSGNAEPEFGFEYEIIEVDEQDGVYDISVIRRFPENPSFAPPVYIRFIIEDADGTPEYRSVMNYGDGGRLAPEDVLMCAAVNYDMSLKNADYNGSSDTAFYLDQLHYACLNELARTVTTSEYDSAFKLEEENAVVFSADLVRKLAKEQYGVDLNLDGVEIYDDETDTVRYPMDSYIYEYFYRLEMLSFKETENGVYEATFRRKHGLSPDNEELMKDIKLTVKIDGDSYKYISVEYTDVR